MPMPMLDRLRHGFPQIELSLKPIASGAVLQDDGKGSLGQLGCEVFQIGFGGEAHVLPGQCHDRSFHKNAALGYCQVEPITQTHYLFAVSR